MQVRESVDAGEHSYDDIGQKYELRLQEFRRV